MWRRKSVVHSGSMVLPDRIQLDLDMVHGGPMNFLAVRRLEDHELVDLGVLKVHRFTGFLHIFWPRLQDSQIFRPQAHGKRAMPTESWKSWVLWCNTWLWQVQPDSEALSHVSPRKISPRLWICADNSHTKPLDKESWQFGVIWFKVVDSACFHCNMCLAVRKTSQIWVPWLLWFYGKKIGTYQAECNTIQLTRKCSLLQNSHPSIHKNSDAQQIILEKSWIKVHNEPRVHPLPWNFSSKKHWSEVKILWMSLQCWPWMLAICRPYVGHTLILKTLIKNIIKPS